MKRLCVLLCALVFFVLGCAADDEKGQWDDFMKELRGDNMKMRNDFTMDNDFAGMRAMQEPSGRIKPPD